ncbi:unnamed protein product [Urochloa humidicola]
MYQDDEPLEPRQISPAPTGGGGGRRMFPTARCEVASLGRSASQDGFPVLVHARATAGAPLDLVAVLDVSSSMRGYKLALLKQAVGFVVDQLGPDDRLSVVTFSAYACRLTRLACMSAAGKAEGWEHAGAARILESRLRAVERSAPGVAGDDPTCEAIKEELRELSARVGDRREYKKTGHTCLLASMSSHAQQRASGVELQATATSVSRTTRAYLTPKMEEMVEMSRERRKRGNSEEADGGSR